MIKTETLEIGKLMSAYTTKGKPIEFKLRESKSKYLHSCNNLATNQGSKYTVLGNLDCRDPRGGYPYFLIEFNSHARIVVCSTNLKSGEIKNPYLPSVCNVGFLGLGVYNPQDFPKERVTWQGMITRCYSEASKIIHPTYKGCSVDERWHNFQNFCEDIQYLDGYKEWKENSEPKKYALDKDIKIEGNKVYSKDTCMFVLFEDNTKMSNKNLGGLLTGKTYLATFLETGHTEHFTNQREFARNNNLHTSEIRKVLRGSKDSHKGWIFETLED